MREILEEVFVWKPNGAYDYIEPCTNGDLSTPHPFDHGMFEYHKPIEQSYLEWRSEKGVRNALSGKPKEKEFLERCQKTDLWVRRGCLDPIVCYMTEPFSKSTENIIEESLALNVLHFGVSEIVVDDKVIEVLDEVCPRSYEKYKISFRNVDTKKQYYILNITQGISEDSLKAPGLGDQHIYRLITDRFFDSGIDVVYTDTLQRALESAGISGLRWMRYGDNPYAK